MAAEDFRAPVPALACRLLVVAAVAVLVLVAVPAAGAAAPMSVDVDLTDVERRIFRVRLVMPVKPGRVSLHYPQWLPGNHAARGPLDQVTALKFTGSGRTLEWRRDPLDVFRFDVTVPAGVSELQAEFALATPQQAGTGQSSRIVASRQLLNLQWNQVVLYPVGRPARDIPVSASIRLPNGWRQAGALRAESVGADPDRLRFETVPLEVLVDSPLFAGPVSATYDLTPAGGAPVRLHVFGDEAADVKASDAQVEQHRKLVREVVAALGPPRYDRYEFLLHLTESISGIGLEHHRSSENSQPPAHFREPESDMDGRDLLAHEMVHSWNGKYRRPSRLWTPHFNTPMQGDLLWVYEGLTQYYGMVLTARSGIWSPEFMRDELAATAAVFDRKRPGRSWRSLEDTTAQPVVTARRPLSWVSSQRTEDYYMESVLLWLDVDTKLRELSSGRRSLDDFAHEFFAAPATRGWVSTYEFDDVVRSLNRVAAFDWAGFLHARVTGTDQPLLQGLERAGYRLAYDDKPNAVTKDVEKASRATDLGYSLGIVVSRDNVLTEVVWDSPAFNAGLTTNTTLVAVNGRATSGEVLKAAVTRAKEDGTPIELLVRNGDRFRTVQIDYRGGLVYPHLVPIEGRRDGLVPILAPRAAGVPATPAAPPPGG
jgi:predicted metalloprotease with PDZ domain